MSEDILYLILTLLLLVALLAYMFVKDKENTLRINKLEKVLEDVVKECYYIKKQLKAQELSENLDMLELKKDFKQEAVELFNQEFNSKILPILKSLKGFESVIEEFQSEQESRLSNLEQKTQNISKLTPNYENEEQKIVDLFKEGKSIEQIAKDLRISTGSVEFTLKMKKMVD